MNVSDKFGAGIREDGRLFNVALAVLMLMVAGTLLYPETFISVGLMAGPFRISPMAVLFMIAAPPIIWYSWIHRRHIRPGIFDVGLLISLVFITARGLFAVTNGNELGLVVAYICYVLLLYYGTAVLGQSRKTVELIFYTLAILAVVISAYALLEYFLANNFLYGSLTEEKSPLKSAVFYRSGSTLAQPAVLGIFMVQVIPILVYLFVVSRSNMQKVLWGAASALSIAALLATFAKGSWVVAVMMGIGATIYVAMHWSRLKKGLRVGLVLFTVSCIVVILIFSLMSLQNLNFNILSEERQQESIDMRWDMWKKAPDVFLQQPMVGVGIWHGGNIVSHLVADEFGFDLESPIPISNVYILILVEEGLIGSMLFAGTLILLGRHAWLVIRNGGESTRIAVPLVLGMIALLLNGMTADSLFIWPAMVLFWFEAGLIRAQLELIENKKELA